MSGFLDHMARSSELRVAAASAHEPAGALALRARATPAPPRLRLSAAGFDVIAELKLRSPAAGALGDERDDWLGRVAAYGRGGAAAVSVLTEPSRFDGSLQHLQHAADVLRPMDIPAMRKDFLVDPYQVMEARAAGAGGILLIVRMLGPARLVEMLDAAREFGLFVLLEAFDAADLRLAGSLLAARPPASSQVLVGLNCRDLQTLQVMPERFAELAAQLPPGWPAVAESGVHGATEAVRVRDLGYGIALIGTALMTQQNPVQLLRDIFAATRTVDP